MKIIVCVKQVPDTNEVRINHETGTLIREGVPSIINPDDLNAIEEAVKIKEKYDDVTVTVITMGPPQAEESLREAYAIGADEVILLSDRVFAGSDTWATATILSSAIETIGNYDIVFCGRQAIDGDTAQVGPEIAEFLNLPQVSYVENLEIKDNKIIAKRKLEDGYFMIESKMPVLLTSIKELNEPRYAHAKRIYEAYGNKDLIKTLTSKDINVDLTQVGVKNSPTNVYKSFVPTKEFNGVIIEGSPKEITSKIIKEFKNMHII